ncbi:MAG: hypothetical protein WBX02_21110 [Terriglobales bacterium]
MDPLITNAIDPALLRVLDKRGRDGDREPANRRRPRAAGGNLVEDRQNESRQEPERQEDELTTELDAPRHKLDDMA